MATFEEFLNEKNITIKRRYTDTHPAKTVGHNARVRNKIIEALKDSKLTLDEFNEIIKSHSTSPKRWSRNNKRFFKIEEDGVSLSGYGKKVLKTIQPVNEAIGTKKPMGLTKDETLEVAKKVAEAIGKVDKVKCTVNMKTLEEDSFDLDYDGDEFDGGSYMIIDDGSVINAAHNGLRVGHMDDSTKDFITFFKKHFGKLAKESVDEGLNKSDIAYQLAMDYTGNSKPKITKLNKKRIQIMYGYKINPQAVIDSIKKVEPDVELKHVEWSDKMTGGGFHIFDILESVNEARASAEKLLKSVTKGETNAVEGIKLSKEMAQAMLDWLKGSTYGKKFSSLPFDKLFSASFNWGLDRYTKNLKDEYKALKTKAKTMKESKIYASFSQFVNESVNEAKVNPSGYVRAGKLGYNDQFLGRRSLSYTLSVDLGMNPDHEFGGGNWLGFDHVSMYNSGGKKNGTILADALKGKYTYAELKSAAADFLGIKESVGVDEGRAFAAAVNRAREAGEETFEFNGKEYKVTKKTKKINEEAIEIKEAEIKSDEDFMEYAMAIYKKAFGDDFDEAKAKEAAEGMLKKSDGDYGAAIGMLQSSIG